MPSAKFDKEELLELLEGDDTDNLIFVEDKTIDKGRWSIHHALVFQEKETGKFYKTKYSVGATEQQDEYPFDNEPDEINCVEVIEKEKVIKIYVTA